MAAPQKLTAAQQKRLVKEYEKGTPVAQITEKFGVSAGTVRAVVQRHEVTLRPVGRPRKHAEA